MTDAPKEQHFENPRDFLNALRKSNPEWCNVDDWNSTWVFRGVADAEWNLKPSAWRYLDNNRRGVTNSFQELFDFIYERDLSDEQLKNKAASASEWAGTMDTTSKYELQRILITQHVFEKMLIKNFMLHLDELGHSIPGKEPTDTDYRIQPRMYDNSIPSVFGLAQHHGIPTRYLDWTGNPLKAIFFAAIGNSIKVSTGRMAVWAWDTSENTFLMPAAIYTVPRGHIQFLHAQEGLFSYITEPLGYLNEHGEWPGMEAIVPQKLCKFTIDKVHAHELLRMLNLEGINHHTLMPTLDNAVKSLADTFPILLKRIERINELGK